jgi:hypothetical protein
MVIAIFAWPSRSLTILAGIPAAQGGGGIAMADVMQADLR